MNIFEGIIKEKFIEEFNKEDNGCLSLMHINLAFDYKGLKKSVYKKRDEIKLRSITDVKNYESEIEVFNSFKPFVEYEEKEVLIINNYNKYLSHRNKLENKLFYPYEKLLVLKFGYYINKKENYLVFYSVADFNRFISKDKIIKAQDSIGKQLINQ